MPDIFELIQQLCPDGVEYRRLGDVCEVKRGDRITKQQICEDGKYPVMSGGMTYFGRYSSYNREAHTITIAQYGSAGYVSWIGERFWANDVCYSLFPRCCCSNRFLYYVLQSNQLQLYSMTTKATPNHLPCDRLLQLMVPIPPLAVQQEIVRILDVFDTYCSDMTAGLAGELAMRRKQFQYWRETLIDQQQDHMAVLGDFFTQVSHKAGAGFPKDQLRVVSNTMGLVSKDAYEQRTQDASEDLCNYKLVGSGEFAYNPRRFDVGSVAYNKESDAVAVSPAYQVFSVDGIHPDYLMHLFRHRAFDRQRAQYTEKGAGVKFTFDKFQYVRMPVPPMAVQLEIVRILNKFQELEQELEQRTRQFEYYRNLLLSFPEKSVA